MKIVSKTDIGLKRENNQDFFAYGELSENSVWAVVCDGMGGAAAGDLASSMAVEIISKRIVSNFREGMNYNSMKNLLASAIAAANIEVYDKSISDSSLNGMGTTVIATIIVDGTACIAHSGDSRAFIYSGDSLRQITKDHSLVQDLVEKGQLTVEEAKTDSRKNIITRALGVDEELLVDYYVEDINENDIFIICTDGLTDNVSNETIFDIIKNYDFNILPEKLIDTANSNGGNDNITIVAVSH